MRKSTAILGLLGVLAGVAPLRAAENGSARLLEQQPRYGMYYDRYEPFFYTGFAPRTLDPRRVHLHLGRGNQLRVTLVLSDEVLRDYARDLVERDRTYRSLVESGQLVLTQNLGLEEFERTLADADVARLVAREASLSPEELRARNLVLLERLNPGRVFHIAMLVEAVMARWAAQVRPADRVHMDRKRQLELINLLLPTRLFVAELDPAVSAQLTALVKSCPEGDAGASLESLRPAFVALVERVSNGIYPVHDGAFRFDEFTAIYPVGTLNAFTTYNGRQIPQYPTPGRRALTTHQRTQTVDHIPAYEFYSYSPWIPYMHVGPRLHNAIHTLYWRMKVNQTSFLPATWRSVAEGSRDGEPYEYIWLLSRGPMSHGCTHLNAGHIAELRQVLPAETDDLYFVDLFLNTSYRYDVFDIDGDLEPEVMGVRYFIAYSLKDGRPDRLRVRDDRHAFYDWLYGGELGYDADDRGVLRGVRDNRFIGREAVDGAGYERLSLHEADYTPERVQFYRLVDIPFARELRKVGVSHRFTAPAPERNIATRQRLPDLPEEYK